MMTNRLKVLICGSNGQLGSDCTRIFNGLHVVAAVDLPEFDITNFSMVCGMMKDFEPDFVINCAAFTNVDACETEKEISWQVNADGPGNLAKAIEQYGGQLIHISTDYVFDGKKKLPDAYLETDKPNPVSAYGRTKLEGEAAIKKTTSHYMILRTAWLYGIEGANFLKTMLRLSLTQPEKEIKVVNDQYGSPTWSFRLALQIKKLMENNGQGIYHTTSEGYCTWFELADYFLKKMNIPYNIKSCSTKEYPTPATRPGNSILENKQLKEAGINLMDEWQKDVDEYIKRFRTRLIDEITRSIG